MSAAVATETIPPSSAGVDRATRSLVLGATAVGAIWRIALLINKWNQGLGFNDSLYYSFQAQQNAHGHWFRMVFTNGPGAEHPPFASLLMTPASLLPHTVFWQRATNTALGIVVIPLIALLAYRVAGRRAAVVAAMLAAVYPNLWMNDSLVMSESTSVLLVVVALLCAHRLQQRFDLRSAMRTGAVVGLAALSRSELILLAPLLAFVGFRGHAHALGEWFKRGVTLIAMAGAVVAPWMLYNLTRFDSPVLLSTNEGITILGANCDQTYSGPVMGGWLTSCLSDVVIAPGEDASELSRREHRLAVSYMRHHVRRLPLVVSARLLRTADLYGVHDLVTLDVGDRRGRVASWSGIVSWWLLAPFAVVGWWRLRRRCGYVMLAPVTSVFATAALFYGAHRLRAPMEPVVVVCAACALTACSVGRRTIDRWLTGRFIAPAPKDSAVEI